MKKNKVLIGIVSFMTALTLAACNDDAEKDEAVDKEVNEPKTTEEAKDTDSHSGHSSTGEVPDGLKIAENPTYEVGSKAIITADHMEGMKDAEATIVGAYETTVYTLTYTPTTGGDPVKNHKWVIQEELKEANDTPLETGTEVTIEADHMEGMKGATAVIESAEETTVYMVDFMPESGGNEVQNHKWVTENELSAE